MLSYTHILDIRDKHIIITLKHNLTRFVYSLRSLSALSFAVNAPSSARYTDTGMAPIVRPHPTLTKQKQARHHHLYIFIQPGMSHLVTSIILSTPNMPACSITLLLPA